MLAGAGAKERDEKQNPANVWPLLWCQGGLWPGLKQSHHQLPARLSHVRCGDILQGPVCGGRRRGECASMWIINRDALDAFFSQPGQIKYDVHLHS